MLSLKSWVFGYNSLTELDISQNSVLKELDSGSNSLTELDVSQNADLEYLDCGWNSLTELDVSQNIKLKYLNFSRNSLTDLDVSQNADLEYLGCATNSLTDLDVSQNTKLEELSCASNSLTELDISQNLKLRLLDCRVNSLTELDVSQNPNLQQLACSSNFLTALDVSQNPNLAILLCNSNSLTELDVSQNANLTKLDCRDNSLTELDVSQNLLLGTPFNGFSSHPMLNCSHNLLTSLDVSENLSLTSLQCNDNPLEYIDMHNGSVLELLITHNNAELLTICLDEQELEYVKSVLSPDSVVLITYCDLLFDGALYEIAGAVTFGSEPNCSTVQDTITGFHFELDNGNSFLYRPNYTDDKYLVRLPEDTYSISLEVENSELFHFTPDTALIELNSTSSPYLQDFCIWPIDSACVDIDITILPLDQARPGFEVDYKLIYENQGNTNSSGIIQIDYPEDISTFIGATPNLIDDQGVLSFGYSDLKPFEEREIYFTMKLNSPMDNPPLTGGRISYTAQITPDEKEYYLPNNEFVLMQDVVNSYDPNDKTCLQGTTLLDNMVGDYVDYLIRFENTGTADAVNITILDEINPEVFDINSLHVTDSSHPVFARTDGDVVQFVFQDIYLPYQESDNKGYVAYKIKT